MPATNNYSKDDLLETGKSKSFTSNVNRCSTTNYRKDDSETADVEMCECSSVPLRSEENVLLRSVVANRGMIHVSVIVIQYTCTYTVPNIFLG